MAVKSSDPGVIQLGQGEGAGGGRGTGFGGLWQYH